MAGVTYADPFGSYLGGVEEGQKFEQDYQESAIDSYSKEMNLLDKLVLAPQRQLEKEQRQYAQRLDLMVRQDALIRQRQAAAASLRGQGGVLSSGGGGMFFSMGSGSATAVPDVGSTPAEETVASPDGFTIRPRNFSTFLPGVDYNLGE